MKHAKGTVKFLSYVLVAAAASGATLGVTWSAMNRETAGTRKLTELSSLIQERFIGEADADKMADAAADAMVQALGDEWSYYISADDYDDYLDRMSNSYVGVGITIQLREDGYLDIVQVTQGGPAETAGVQPGDVLTKVNGEDVEELGIDRTKDLVRGEEGSEVLLTVTREDLPVDISVTRKYFETTVADGKLIDGSIGLITIRNFDERSAKETLATIDRLIDEGAKGLIFDVRNNPGGYKTELVKILDALLPEGELFRSEYYNGAVDVDQSDPESLDIPMAVLVNKSSYSAAEFFAAALREYDAAILVGEQTYGKGYFQQTFELEDGSAVGLSVGKYYTPKGENLAGVGLTPDVEVPVDEEMALKILARTLNEAEDPQISAAIAQLKAGIDLDD